MKGSLETLIADFEKRFKKELNQGNTTKERGELKLLEKRIVIKITGLKGKDFEKMSSLFIKALRTDNNNPQIIHFSPKAKLRFY